MFMQNSSVEKKKIYLLYNPKSGKEKIKDSLGDIIEIFSRAGFELTVYPTSYAGEATEIVENLPQMYDLVVCCGGDGTLNEVVAGNLRRERIFRLGYIPCGSTNDFGNTIYEDTSMLKAVYRIAKEELHLVDCGRLQDKSFVYAAAFGLFTDISYETPHSKKAALGHAAYLIEAVKNLGNIKVNKVKAVIDGSEVIEGDFLIGMVTNADSIGGFQNIAGKDVSLQDGELELTMIAKPKLPGRYRKILQALLDGSENKYVIRRKVKNVEFLFKEPTSFTLDGEYGGTYGKAHIECLPEAIPLIY